MAALGFACGAFAESVETQHDAYAALNTLAYQHELGTACPYDADLLATIVSLEAQEVARIPLDAAEESRQRESAKTAADWQIKNAGKGFCRSAQAQFREILDSKAQARPLLPH